MSLDILDTCDLLLPGIILTAGALIGVFFLLKDAWKHFRCEHFYVRDVNLGRCRCEKCGHIYIEKEGRVWH